MNRLNIQYIIFMLGNNRADRLEVKFIKIRGGKGLFITKKGHRKISAKERSWN